MLIISIFGISFLSVLGYLYVKSWIFTIQSYISIWDSHDGILTNLLAAPNQFSVAFLTVHIAAASQIGIYVFLMLLCSI